MAVVNILAWVIVGGIAGWLAGLVVQGTGMGIVGDIIVGIVGALIGGFVLSLLCRARLASPASISEAWSSPSSAR